jgi:hypothetical protein
METAVETFKKGDARKAFAVFREAKKLWDLLEIENNGQGGVL